VQKNFLHRIWTPGSFQPKGILLSGLLIMVIVYIFDWITPHDIRLHMLYIFPLVMITIHCERHSDTVIGFILASTLQLVSFIGHRYSLGPLSTDMIVALASSWLSVILAKSYRKNYLESVSLSTTDWLTGLQNRRSFEGIMGIEIERQKRYGGVFSLAVIDLDGFKLLNDSRGHQDGDSALRLVAKVLKENIRQSDTTARLGGDEFVILMPNTIRDDCNSLCQLLSRQVASDMERAGFAITASIGCTSFDQSQDSTMAALAKADKAMYEAKAKGKNCVVCQ
jgi:diguanylate cyclase (GGDEF)-like protein